MGINKPICLSMSLASSTVARGITPGSEKLVLSRVNKTNRKRRAATAGRAGLTFTARYGALKENSILISHSKLRACIFLHLSQCIDNFIYRKVLRRIWPYA